MLAFLRKRVKYLSWILWVVILVFVVYMFYDFGSAVPQDVRTTAVAVSAGPLEVSADDFQQQYRRTEEQIRQMYGEQFSPELAQQMGLPRRVLDDLINSEILLAEARRLGLAATDAEVREAILEVPGLTDAEGRFVGGEEYQARLRAIGFTPARFEQEIRDDILLNKLRSVFRANLYVSEGEIERTYRDQVEKARIRYVLLPRSRFAGEAQVSQQDLAAYFAAHQDDYKLPAQRRVAYLLVEPGKLADEVEIDEAALTEHYDQHKQEFAHEEEVRARHILLMVNEERTDEEARKRLEEARRRIEGGAAFAAVAGELSEDPGSKANGGDLGFFGRGRMVKEFEDAAFGAQPGQLVGPIRSSFGYHLLEVTDRRAGGVQPFAEVREAIRGRLAAERAQEIAEARAKEIAEKLADAEPESAEEVQALTKEYPAATYGVTQPFGAQDPILGIGPAPAFNTAAFELEQGAVSKAIQIPSGWAVLWVQEALAPRTPELSEVEPRVRQAAETEKVEKLALDRLSQAREQLEQGKTLADVAAELGVEVAETPEFGAQGVIPELGYNPELAKAALALEQGQVGGPIASPQGALLFEVIERKGWDPQEFQAQKAQTRATLEASQVDRLLGALIEQRRRELEVTYNRQLLESYGMQLEPQAG